MYILVKVLHDPGFIISLPGLPTGVVPIEVAKFTYYKPHGGDVTLEQFPVTLAYIITDFKCQGKTFRWIIVDMKAPTGFGSGSSSATSAYVQLSRVTSSIDCRSCDLSTLRQRYYRAITAVVTSGQARPRIETAFSAFGATVDASEALPVEVWPDLREAHDRLQYWRRRE
jgi:hypothetical protein